MEKREISKFLDGIFSPLGYDKKRNLWKLSTKELEKIIMLQKSSFSNSYYLNYGFNLIGFDLDGLEMHVFKGFGSHDDIENKKIMELLDMRNNISESTRTEKLKAYIEKNILLELHSINTRRDLTEYLRKLPNKNSIPLIVKEELGL